MVLATTTQTPERFLSDAITGYLIDFAMQTGFTSELETDEDSDGNAIVYRTPSAADCVTIARQTVTVAAVLSDLCDRMGVTPPATVLAALTDEPPY